MLNELMSLITEANETSGLFPGLSSSAFDEHRKAKKTPPTVDGIKKQMERLEELIQSLDKYRHKAIRTFRAREKWQSTGASNEERLISQPWMDKYPHTKRDLSQVMVDTNAPSFNKLERLVSSYETAAEQKIRYKATIKKLKSKILRVRKQEAERNLKSKSAATPQKQINVDDIPNVLPVKFRTERWSTGKADTFKNPYFLHGAGSTAYAGHPSHFTEWKGRLRTMYYEIESWVKKLGHPELDMMYASNPRKIYSSDEFLRYYLTNSDGSVVVTNSDRSGKIHVFAKSKNLPASEPPLRWRMRRLLAKDLDWITTRLQGVKK